MTTEQLERFKRYGIPIDDGLIRLAQIGEENKVKMQAAAERREAEKEKKSAENEQIKKTKEEKVTGFDSASEKQAKEIEKAIQAKIKELSKDADNKDRVEELNKSLDDIQQMRNDRSAVYSYKKLGSNDARGRQVNGPAIIPEGQNKKGQDLISMYGNTIGELLHESRHGGDMARRTLSKDFLSNYGVSHEINAYKAQYGFDGYIDYLPVFDKSNPKHAANYDEYGLKQGTNKNYREHFTDGVNNINADFVNGIVWFYNGTTPEMLYSQERTRVRKDIWNSR